MARRPAPMYGHDHLRAEVRRLRLEQDVSLPALASAAGYANHAHLAAWERGKPGIDLPVARLQRVLARLGHTLTLGILPDET